MNVYLDLLRAVLDEGEPRGDRTGTGTRSLFGYQMRFDLERGFPLLTTKKVHWKSVALELLWFISGSTNAADLRQHGVTIWDEWSTEEQCARFGRAPGDLGPIYGHQWRNFGATQETDGTYRKDGVDQLLHVIDEIRRNPESRRLIVSGWNPKEASSVALPPCHTLFQFYVGGGRLSCQLYQRSGDVFLGVPFNIASYALLTCLIAKVTGLKPGVLVHSIGDAHLYENHLEQARLQITREPRPLPSLKLAPMSDLFAVRYEDIELRDYDPHPPIRAKVSV